MIQEYIEAYPQGLSLGEQQKVYLDDAQDTRYHTVLHALPTGQDISVLELKANEVIAGQVALSFAFNEVTGFRGIRQTPKVASPIKVTEHKIDTQQSIELNRLGVLVPVALNPQTGINIQLVVLVQGDKRYLLVRSNALCIDLPSTELLVKIITSTEQVDEEALQYPDFLAWLAEMSDSEDAQEGKAYWQQYQAQLGHHQTGFALPYHKAPEVSQLTTQQSVSFDINSDLASQVETIAEQLALESSAIYQGLWWLLLARISQSSGFIAGVGYDPRLLSEELEGALGVYQQTLPILVPEVKAQTLTQWLEQLNFTVSQHVEWAESYAVTEHLPIISNAIHIQNNVLDVVHSLSAVSTEELNLVLSASEEAINVELQFDSAAYSIEAANALLAQLQTLIAGLATNLDKPVANIALASEKEQAQHLALNAFEDVPVELVLTKLKHFASQTPQALALQGEEVQLSYQALDTLIEQCAVALVNRGIKQGDFVALSLHRSWQQVVTLLAVMRAGAAYCPIDPVWPEQRKAQILTAAAPQLVISNHNADEQLNIEQFLNEANMIEQAQLSQLPSISAEQAAYLLFTSGSTGMPKGVVIEHAQLAQYCYGSSKALNLDETRYALTSTVAADIGNTCLFNAFYNGAALIVASEEQVLDGQAFGEFVQTYQIDCVKIVPSHLQALLDGEPTRLPTKLILGGESSNPALLQKIHLINPDTIVYNHYGPTEATVGVLAHHYPALNSFADTVPKLSQVFAGTEIFILNAQGELAATGEQGELFIAGKQLSKGYLNQLENEAFISGSRWAERLYATGDLARYMPDNTISLLGRKDDQVQIRGFRIEPNDVAMAITNHLVDTQVYVAVQKQGNEDCLVAFLVGYQIQDDVPSGLLTGEYNQTLQVNLRQVLPEAMVPTFFVALERLPLLQNGKVDRKALPLVADLSMATYVAPSSQLETLLANTLADILDVEKVSCDASFFDLGGHSLSAIKFVTRVKKLLLVNIEPGLVFDNPSVQSLAQALNNISNNPSRLEKIALTQLKLAQLTPEQQAALRQKMGLTT